MSRSAAHFFLFSALGFSLSAAPVVLAQAGRQLLPANLLIPQPPPSAPLVDWADSPEHSKVSQVVPDGVLRGWDYKPPSPTAPILLFFNGNGMTVDRSDSLYRSLVRAGSEVIVYDYRGIGFSSGAPDVLTFRRDSMQLYDAVVDTHPGRRVVVFGFSLGTAMASFVASQRSLAGLILAGTIATAADEFPVYMRVAGFGPGETSTFSPASDAVEAFDEVDNVAKSAAPLLMLHGEADTLVPIAQGRKVFAASPSSQKRFVPLPGTGHNGTAGSPASIEAVGQFLSRLARG